MPAGKEIKQFYTYEKMKGDLSAVRLADKSNSNH
jgi:hypothetical protein